MNRQLKKTIRIAILIIDNISIGFLWAIALTLLAIALFIEMTK